MNPLNLVMVRNVSFKWVEETEVRWKCGENKVEDDVWGKRKIEKKEEGVFISLKLRIIFFLLFETVVHVF